MRSQRVASLRGGCDDGALRVAGCAPGSDEARCGANVRFDVKQKTAFDEVSKVACASVLGELTFTND